MFLGVGNISKSNSSKFRTQESFNFLFADLTDTKKQIEDYSGMVGSGP